MKKYINKIRKLYEENDKKTIVIYVVLKILTLVCLIRELMEGSFQKMMICGVSLILFVIPFWVEKRFKLKLPSILKMFAFFYIFASEVLGEVNNFYGNIFWWDIVLHFSSGFFVASVGFSLIYLLNKNNNFLKLNPFFVGIVVVCFSMTIGVLWEFYEYGMDLLLDLDMQRDRYVNEINSVTFDPLKDNNVIDFKKIDYTIIYDEEDNEIARWNGYLDIGLHDTMKDLIINLGGAFLFGVFGYLYIIDKKKYRLVGELLIKRCCND